MSVTIMTPDASILDSPDNILVCPVNCVPGVMGKGLAKVFADRWPLLKDIHRKSVDLGLLAPGCGHMVWVTGEPGRPDPFGVYLFPTKDHWRDPSEIGWIWDGLDRMSEHMAGVADRQYGENAVNSVSIPALGCGLGGLPWGDVLPLIESMCAAHPGVKWSIYPPKE